VARDFDGINDKARIASSTALDVSSGASIAMWLRRTGDDWSYPVSRGDKSSTGWSIVVTSTAQGFPYVTLENAGVQFNANTSSFRNDSVWHHLGLTWDGSNIRFYSDGSLITTVAATSIFGITGQPLDIGFDTSDNDSWPGDIAEFGYWVNRVLSDAEMAALGKGYTPNHLPRNLAVYVPLLRDNVNVMGTGQPTLTGTTVVAHPPVIRPSRRIYIPFSEAGAPTVIDLTVASLGFTGQAAQNLLSAVLSSATFSLVPQSVQNRISSTLNAANLSLVAQPVQNRLATELTSGGLSFLPQGLQNSSVVSFTVATLSFVSQSIQNSMIVRLTAATLGFTPQTIQNTLAVVFGVATLGFIAQAIDVTGAAAAALALLRTLLGVGQ
jgi:hypothetical protein